MNEEILTQKPIIKKIFDTVSAIKPIDEIEKKHIENVLKWLVTTESIFRIKKPDVPKQHLVSYVVLYDKAAKKIMLTDHKLAQLWLPAGGHVDIDENPKEAARRECFEELEIEAKFYSDIPVFLTITTTQRITPHIDVSLWYVLEGNHKEKYNFDKTEFRAIQWFALDKIPYEQSDPHMRRFVKKLQNLI